MIKLNNKNITYLALADSNNSLKAPKEVWYADSNNSVKLVYRRKDALIEGEDYEKYHWLKGDGTAFINTLQPVEPDDELICSIIPVAANLSNWQYVYGNNAGDNAYTFMCVLITSNRLHFRHKRGTTNYSVNTRYNIVHSINSVEVNGDSIPYSTEDVYVENDRALVLFNAQAQDNNYIFDGYISNVILSSKLNFIPCKLLKPVPKWLDANGIRRQVGECGMIDLVSGKFYGNVNSVGTFSVENYYERKEWLVGDGSAFLSTTNGLTGLNSVEWELSGNGQAVLNSFALTTGAAQFVSDLSYVDGSIGKIGIYDNNRGYFWTTKLDVNTLRLVSGTTIKAVTINDVDLSNPNYQWNGYFILQFINRAAGYKVSKVTVDGSVRYVPCTLTMDLPASMDANNIARTKGTSGMWDLVSDRFYGNVASSGTFKAVNLAEGVDYEVHQWLKGDGSAYIDTGIKLTETDVITTKIIATTIPSGGPTDYYIVYGNNSGTAYNTVCALFGNSLMLFRPTKTNDITFQIRYYVDTEYEIVQSNTSIDINNQQVWQGSSIFESIDWNCLIFASVNTQLHNFNGKIAYFLISDKINLIPVKLLRSIPSKYDANGIARQAGECGMYDTINDVFYGNVASSGTFTVSDNE